MVWSLLSTPAACNNGIKYYGWNMYSFEIVVKALISSSRARASPQECCGSVKLSFRIRWYNEPFVYKAWGELPWARNQLDRSCEIVYPHQRKGIGIKQEVLQGSKHGHEKLYGKPEIRCQLHKPLEELPQKPPSGYQEAKNHKALGNLICHQPDCQTADALKFI